MQIIYDPEISEWGNLIPLIWYCSFLNKIRKDTQNLLN